MTPWVAFALLGALLFAVGNALQKHALAGRLPAQSVRTLAARPLRFFLSFAGSRTWLLALGIGVAGAIVLAAALADRHPTSPAAEWSPALAAGALFGLGDVMLKAGTESVRVRLGGFDLAHADTLAALALAPGFQLGIGLTATAFLLQQLAFSRGRVSVSAPVVGVGATLLVVLLGVSFLGESFGAGRALGVALTVIGTLLLAGGRESGSQLSPAAQLRGERG